VREKYEIDIEHDVDSKHVKWSVRIEFFIAHSDSSFFWPSPAMFLRTPNALTWHVRLSSHSFFFFASFIFSYSSESSCKLSPSLSSPSSLNSPSLCPTPPELMCFTVSTTRTRNSPTPPLTLNKMYPYFNW